MKLRLKDGTKIAGLIGVGVFVMFFNFIAATLLIKFGWAKISVILFSISSSLCIFLLSSLPDGSPTRVVPPPINAIVL